MKHGLGLAILALVGHLYPEEPSRVMYTILPGSDIVLRDDYGFVLVNDGDNKHPVPRYILGVKGRGKIVDTKDLKAFSRALATLPKRKTLYEYDSCSVSRSSGLTSKQHSAFKSTLKKSGLKVSDQIRITCYYGT